MDIQAQKALIIEQFKQVDDISLINAIKSLLDYASKKENEYYDIPESHQELVMERFENVRKVGPPDLVYSRATSSRTRLFLVHQDERLAF